MPLLLALILAFPLAFAETNDGLDEASRRALLKTQQMLRNRQERREAIDKDGRAQEADQFARDAGGSAENVDAIYDLSADIMADITKQAGGDPAKMQKLMNDALRDPEAFANKLSPKQKAKLKAIAEKTPAAAAQKRRP